MELKRFEFNMFGENTYVLSDKASREAAIVDPGMVNSRERAELDSYIASEQLQVKAILLTHMHIDHTFGVDYAKEKYGAPVIANRDDEYLGSRRIEQARMFHLPIEMGPIVVDRFIEEGETVMLGKEKIEVLKAPGHSKGSLLFYVPESNFVLTGDVLFRNSIGRTDLVGGDHQQLIDSIHTKLVTLPPSTIVYPGHGPETTIAAETAHNPFF